MPLTAPGLSSGINTDEMIEKLVEAERAPILKYEQQIAYLQYQNESLIELKKKLVSFEATIRKLYDYNSPFEKKILQPSEEGFLDGVANKNAEQEDHEIEILNIASKLKISSNPIAPDQEIAPTTITINEKSEKFSGGTLEEFNDFLNKKFSEELTAKKIRKNKNEEVLIIQSAKEGLKGELEISDDSGVLKELGLVSGEIPDDTNGTTPDDTPPIQKDKFVSLKFELDKLSTTKEGPAEISSNSRELTLSEQSARALDIIAVEEENKKIAILKLETQKREKPVEKKDVGPFAVETGPIEKLTIKHITLETYNIERQRPQPVEKEKAKEIYGVKIITASGERVVELQNSGTNVEIPLTEVPTQIEFFTNDADVTFKNVQLGFKVSEPVVAEDTENNGDELDPELARQQKLYPNLIEPARNAHMKLDGIEIEREKNDALKDVIDGAELNLKQATEKPIQVQILPNTDDSILKINEFITEYNELLDFLRFLTQTADNDKPGDAEYEDILEDSGPLIADPTVRNFLNGLRVRMFNAYPAVREPEIQVLAMLGISTGEPGAGYAETKDGYLKLNEEIFIEMLTNHPQAVREFFGMDSSGDGNYNTGMAFIVSKYMKPYISNAKRTGIITVKIDSNKSRIKDIKKDIAKKEAHLKTYEENLRFKFMNMEKAVGSSKRTGEYLRQSAPRN
ncbi:MAG: flagellar filament capping protein FliD [Leptospirales bacterium]